MRCSWLRSLICVWLATSLAFGGCRGTAPTTAPARPPSPMAAAKPAVVRTAATGRPTVEIDRTQASGSLRVDLVDGVAPSKQAANASELTPNDTKALLARLEPLPDLSAQNAKAPAVRAPSPAPPRAGTAQPIAFSVVRGKPVTDGAAPAVRPTPPPAAPLTKPEISPSSDVERETEVRIRFSEPMVAVAAVGAADKPVASIVPAVPGSWRWIDTRVATFTSKTPASCQASQCPGGMPWLPNATEYTVTVPAGTKSLAGNVLGEPTEQKFRTRALTLKGVFPTEPVRPDSAIAVIFDQDFDPAKVMPFLRVVHGKKAFAYRTVTLEEAERLWQKNPSLAYDRTQLADTLGRHYLLLAPVAAWPSGVAPQIALGKRAPSREGPLLAERDSHESFTVAPAFTVQGVWCGNIEKPRLAGLACPMRSFAEVWFSNPIDEKSFRADKVQIEGETFEDHAASYNGVSLLVPDGVGRALAVAIAPDLADIYGQSLTGPRRPTFTVAKQRFDPFVYGPEGLVMLDPRFAIPQWIVHAEAVTALHVQLFAVTPADFFAYEAFERRERTTPPGKKVLDKFFPVGPRHGAWLRTDLRPHLGAQGTGHVIAVVHAQPAVPHREWTPKKTAWLQVTKLGATVRTDGERLNAFVQDIGPNNFLKPIAGATTSLVVEGRTETSSATTDAQGHVELALLSAANRDPKRHEPTALLQVQAGADSMFTTINGHERAQRNNIAVWYVTDDRFTYKPGETVYVKGWVRWTHNGVNPDLALPAPSDTVTYKLVDDRGNTVATGTAPVSDHGGFDLEVALPANTNLGTSTFTFTTKTSTHRHPIAVQEFRRPAYSVSLDEDVTHSGATHLVLGETIEMQATAKYYAGGNLPGAAIEWSGTLEAVPYTPPGWTTFAFHPTRREWAPDRSALGYRFSRPHTLSADSLSTTLIGVTSVVDDSPSVLSVDATVTDVDRMTIRASSRPILVHPSTLYVGSRLKPRTHDVLEVIVTDIDGNPVAGVPIDVSIEAVLGSERSRRDAKIVDTQSCKLTSKVVPVECTIKLKDAQWVFSTQATVADARGRKSFTTLDLPWYSYAGDFDLALVPDKKLYRVGDLAKLEIKSKQVPALAIVSFARQGVIAQRRVELAKPSTTIEIPIEPGWIENVHVVVDHWANKRRQNGKTKLPLPEAMSSYVTLNVDIESARLAMRTRPLRPLVEPGGKATFEVEVMHDGKATPNAEVALIVVDEAVLALSGRSHADPLAPFYESVAEGTRAAQSITDLRDDSDKLDGKPGFERYPLDDHTGSGSGRGFGSGSGSLGGGSYGTIGRGGGVVISRKDFRATAAFSPRLRTDANGKVRLSVTMPDSLTRFRVVALATWGTRNFGKAESAIVTQRKVNARTVAPRFLSQGDAFSLPVVVQNLDSAERTIDVAARAANLVAVGSAGKRVTLGAGQRAELRFDFKTKERGQAVVQTIAVSGDFADASNTAIPVYEPATTESFATYGVVDDADKFERLEVPGDIFEDVGGVEVTMQSTQLQSLTDAYWYLYAYPFECAEQRSSRMIATAAVFDILDAFATPGRPSKQVIEDTAKADIKKLVKDQLPDGGWGYFHGMKSDLFVTAQVLTALAAHRVSGKPLTNAVRYVTTETTKLVGQLEAAAAKPGLDRTDRSKHAAWVSLAATLFTALAATKQDVRARAERLHATATALGVYPIEAKARLLSIVAKLGRAQAMRSRLVADLVSATHETAASATVTTKFDEAERAVLASNNRTTALALDALMREAPEHALVQKLARGVLDARDHGRWSTTQENLVVLQTLRRFFDTYEKATPNYTGKLWFGTAAYAEQSFAGRSTVRGVAQLDWSQLPARTAHDVALQKTGPGRMYYRVGITYAPKQADLPALDAGFLVRRSYTAIDEPGDVTKLQDGRIKIRLGARVRVTLEMINSTQRHAVALVDPLPAGLEAVNEVLATSERVTRVQSDARWDFQNVRDTRVEVFEMDLEAGSHSHTYTARATTPGKFFAAPAKAEEMYSPETFGRSTGVSIVIE